MVWHPVSGQHQSLPKWLLQTHLARKPGELRHMKFLQALWEKLLDWGWQTKLAPLLGNSCSVNSLLIIQQRILSRGWVKGEAEGSLVSPSCGKAPVKNTLTLSTILLCSGTSKNKQTGFVFFPDHHLSELLAYIALSLIVTMWKFFIFTFVLSLEGKEHSVAQCYIKWGDTTESKFFNFIP